MNKFTVALLCALILNLIGANDTSAQLGIISPVTTTVLQLNPEQTIRYNKVVASGSHINYQLVHIEPIATAQQNGEIAVSFTHAPCPTNNYFKAENVEYYGSDSNYYWYGHLSYQDSASECTTGNIMLIASNGEHFGQIQIQQKTFELTDLTGGIQVLAQYDTNSTIKKECGNMNTFKTTEPLVYPSGENSFCNVRVLVLYTPVAKSKDPNILNRITLAMSQTKQALLNSNVSSGFLNLVHAGSQEVLYAETPYIGGGTPTRFGGINYDYYQMTDSGDTYNIASQVRYYRDIYKADIVIMMVNATKNEVLGGRVSDTIQDRVNPYAVVDKEWATNSSYTFAHEFGHILGARHFDDDFGADTTNSIAHAHLFSFTTTSGFWPFKKTYVNVQKTITWGFSKNDGQEVLHYSSPTIDYKGTPTGTYSSTHGARNAALHFRNIGCTVAGYNAVEYGEFSASTSMESVCAYQPSVVRAHITGSALGTYLYEWRQSTDGINYGSVLGSASTLNFNMPPNTAKIHFRVKVTDPTGAIKYAYQATRALSFSGCNLRLAPNEEITKDVIDKTQILAINPIPANDNVSVHFNLHKPSVINIEIYDNMGRLVKKSSSESLMSEGMHTFKSSLADIADGFYFLKFKSDEYSQTEKLLIQH